MKGVEGVEGVEGWRGGKGVGRFWNHMLLGGGWEGGGSVVTDRESPLTVIFSDSSRIFLVFTPSVH